MSPNLRSTRRRHSFESARLPLGDAKPAHTKQYYLRSWPSASFSGADIIKLHLVEKCTVSGICEHECIHEYYTAVSKKFKRFDCIKDNKGICTFSSVTLSVPTSDQLVHVYSFYEEPDGYIACYQLFTNPVPLNDMTRHPYAIKNYAERGSTLLALAFVSKSSAWVDNLYH